jgi:SsrA-binding protein
MARESGGDRQICENRKARHDYFIEERVEAGMVLSGAEVKSLRDGRANLKDSYARISRNGEVYLVGAHISPYSHAVRDSPEPDRERKLLLHRGEIDRLGGKVRERGYTLVPTRMYFKNGRAKVELGLARGKEMHDKRDSIRKAEGQREIEREMKSRRRVRGA